MSGPEKIAGRIGRFDAATLERSESLFWSSFLRDSQRKLHEWNSFRALQYKTYVHSLSFDASFVLIDVLQWSRSQSKSALKLLGHPVFACTVHTQNCINCESLKLHAMSSQCTSVPAHQRNMSMLRRKGMVNQGHERHLLGAMCACDKCNAMWGSSRGLLTYDL